MAAKIQQKKISELAAKSFYNSIKTNLEEDSIYAGTSYIPESDYTAYAGSLDSESTFWGGIDSDGDYLDETYYNQTLITLHKVLPGGVSRVIPRVDWEYRSKYNINDYVLSKQVESGYHKLRVYKCLHAPNDLSSNPPLGSAYDPVSYLDGYVWKYMYTIQNVDSIKFLTTDWMPVPEKIKTSEFSNINSGSYIYDQYLTQINAEPYTVWGAEIDSDVLINYYNNTASFRSQFNDNAVTLIGIDNPSNSEGATKTVKLELTYNPDNSTFTSAIIESGKNYHGPVTFGWDSDTTVDGISGVVSPGMGHGSDVPRELNATGVMVSVRNIPDEYLEEVYNGSKYNLITLHINPIDDFTERFALQDYYSSSLSFTCANNSFVVNDTIRSVSDNTKIATVVGVYGDRVFYIFTAGGEEDLYFSIGENIETLGGSKTNTVTGTYNRGTVINSSEMIIADYLGNNIIERTSGQIESFNFVLKF